MVSHYADIDSLTPVIAPGYAAALCIGSSNLSVVVDPVSGLPAVTAIARVALSIDQRAIDMDVAGRFLTAFSRYMTQPHLMA